MTRHIKHVVSLGECMIELRATGYATGQGQDDPYSRQMLSAWQAEQIGTGLVARIQDRLPGLYTIQVDAGGERTFSYWRQCSAAKAGHLLASTVIQYPGAIIPSSTMPPLTALFGG